MPLVGSHRLADRPSSRQLRMHLGDQKPHSTVRIKAQSSCVQTSGPSVSHDPGHLCRRRFRRVRPVASSPVRRVGSDAVVQVRRVHDGPGHEGLVGPSYRSQGGVSQRPRVAARHVLRVLGIGSDQRLRRRVDAFERVARTGDSFVSRARATSAISHRSTTVNAAASDVR